jgi:hypothetical protein
MTGHSESDVNAGFCSASCSVPVPVESSLWVLVGQTSSGDTGPEQSCAHGAIEAFRFRLVRYAEVSHKRASSPRSRLLGRNEFPVFRRKGTHQRGSAQQHEHRAFVAPTRSMLRRLQPVLEDIAHVHSGGLLKYGRQFPNLEWPLLVLRT